MKSAEIPVFNMTLFDESARHFWMDDLTGLLEKFPELEFPHKQNFYSILIVEEAEGEIEIDNLKIRLDKAKVIIIKPRCIVSININRQANGKIICFTEDFFSLRYNNNILYQFSFFQVEALPFIRLKYEQKKKFDILLKFIFEEFLLNSRETQKVLRSYLNIILFELDRLYNPIIRVKIKNVKHEKIQEFERLIDKYFDTKKMPSEYAELLNVSANYLNKICKEETGQTAGDLIRKRITIEGQRLLHYTNYTIKEIAYKLGFENVSYFITFFKKQTGVTPEQFRKLN